jgi:amino-acid N-acetyltransferase
MALAEEAVTVAPAVEDDGADILRLLEACALPVRGVKEALLRDFFVAHMDHSLAGVCGLEVHGTDGLLRSVAVDPQWRRRGVAEALLEAALGRARSLHLRGVYLLTTSAHDYFARRGFADYARDAAPEGIRKSWEFRAGCPSSSSLMRRAV